jgi:DEAD/DEAH box helicase domain-containing protein
VAITRDLFEFGLNHGYLIYQAREGQAVRLPVDWNLDAILRKTNQNKL